MGQKKSAFFLQQTHLVQDDSNRKLSNWTIVFSKPKKIKVLVYSPKTLTLTFFIGRKEQNCYPKKEASMLCLNTVKLGEKEHFTTWCFNVCLRLCSCFAW